MSNFHSNKILPLTVRQLKKAELLYRSLKQQIYDMTSYEFISIAARVVKTTIFQIRLTDETDILDIPFPSTSLKKSADPATGHYYKFFFFPRRNALTLTSDFSAFQIVGISKLTPNQITIHFLTCMQQKLARQNSILNSKTHDQTTLVQIPAVQQAASSNSISKANGTSVFQNPKRPNGEYEILKFCRQFGKEFDIALILNHFGAKFSAKDVEKILQGLSEKGSIMDLGLVYEWVGDES